MDFFNILWLIWFWSFLWIIIKHFLDKWNLKKEREYLFLKEELEKYRYKAEFIFTNLNIIKRFVNGMTLYKFQDYWESYLIDIQNKYSEKQKTDETGSIIDIYFPKNKNNYEKYLLKMVDLINICSSKWNIEPSFEIDFLYIDEKIRENILNKIKELENNL